MAAEAESKVESRIHSDSDEDGNEILEESPCGRWQKRKEKVPQRDIPGIDMAYLAMDNELGVEVVWNEVQFSERKNFRAQEDKIKNVFDHLMQLQHVNLVKFHKYWMDANPEKPRVIFITEYMSSGSMSNFLKRTRKSSKTLSEKAWKKWCIQILTALNYLHGCEPPIVHGNLTCNTIFIQHNGLIKIGCVAPEAIHHHVKTFRENMKNMHYIAPETTTTLTPAVDSYAFGICALEMAVLGFQTNGDSTSTVVSQELIEKTIQSLEDPLQVDFIQRCLKHDPKERPTARELLFHPILFEVPSLRLLAAHHVVINNKKIELTDDDLRMKDDDKQKIGAEIVHHDGRPSVSLKYSEVSMIELDKLLEDVRNGIFPLTAYAVPVRHIMSRSILSSGSVSESRRITSPTDLHHQSNSTTGGNGPGSHHVDSSGIDSGGSQGLSHCGLGSSTEDTKGSVSPTGTSYKTENRRAITIAAEIKPSGSLTTDGAQVLGSSSNSMTQYALTILLKMEDRMSRQLTADICDNDTSETLANELVHYGLINEEDRNDISNLISTTLLKYKIEHFGDANGQ